MFTKRAWLTPAILATTVLVAAPAHSFNLFGLFKPNHQKTFQEHAPADTVFYVEGEYNLDQFPTVASHQAYRLQIEMLLKQFSTLSTDIEDGMAYHLSQLLLDYLQNMELGTKAFTEYYGLADNLAYAFYMDGLYPVLNIALARNNQLFAQTIDQHIQQLGGTTESLEIEGATVYRMVIEHHEWPTGLSLAWLQNGTLGTVALVDFNLSNERIADVLAIKKETHSLYRAKTINSLKKRYNYGSESVGFFDIVRLTQSLVDPGSTKMAADLANTNQLSYEFAHSESCQAEYVRLAQQVPRLVFGSQQYKFAKEEFDVKYQLTLELSDTEVTTDLSKLNGYLASHALDASKNTLGFAVGSDFVQLAPVVGKLWNQMTRADVSCEQLIELQDALITANPLASLQAAAMLNGIKGYAVSLFDLAFDDSMLPTQFDALATITAENPMLFVNLAKSFLPFPGLEAIEAGKEIVLPIPDAIIDAVFVNVSDKHIGIYTGEKGRTAFAAESQSASGKPGIFGLSLNYAQYARIADPLFTQLSGTMIDDYETCLMNQLTLINLQAISGELSYVTRFDATGLTTQLDVQLGSMQTSSVLNLAGSYDVSVLNDYCEWEAIGEETIYEDNTGFYDAVYEGDACAYERYVYDWSLEGFALNVTDTAQFERATCSAEWQDFTDELDPDDASFTCTLLSWSDTGFTCAIPLEDTYELYRYTIQ